MRVLRARRKPILQEAPELQRPIEREARLASMSNFDESFRRLTSPRKKREYTPWSPTTKKGMQRLTNYTDVDRGYAGIGLDYDGSVFMFRVPNKVRRMGAAVPMSRAQVEGLMRHLRIRLSLTPGSDEATIDESGFMGVTLDDQGGRMVLILKSPRNPDRYGLVELTRPQAYGVVSHLQKRLHNESPGYRSPEDRVREGFGGLFG